MRFTDTSEKGFQKYITNYLVKEHKYSERTPDMFDKEFCVNDKELLSFIEITQKENYEFIQKKGTRNFLVHLDEKIRSVGVIEVLRKGLKHYDKTIDLFYRQPSSSYNLKDQTNYQANIFSVTQELKYTLNNENRLDLTIFVNGIPVVTLELKNPLSGQTVFNGIRQYQNDRDPDDKIFTFARCMVHFAADTENVFMSAHLKGKKTDFLPFNKGLNDGKPYPPFGKGNPVNPQGFKTHFLWEDVLSKSSLSNIIDKYAQVVEEVDEDTGKKKRKMIFPRYHQLTVVQQILAHTKENNVGQKYLIQHSAGSGKSNSIAWLAHQLIGLHDHTGEKNIFDSVIVVTDRTVLDKQLRDNIKEFAQVKGVVEAITGEGASKTSQLRDAIANRKKIIICTVQTFPHLLNEMQDLGSLKFGIIIDEAHSSQSGDTSAKMNAVLADKNDEEAEDEEELTLEDKINALIESRGMINNGSYFAFTATPKNKTLETFGTPEKYKDGGDEKTRYLPFHIYSMKQAIEEEFILDVLENYTTYTSFYKLIKATEGNPSYDTKQAQKKLRSYVEGHEYAISQKAKIMLDHFHQDVRHLIKGEAKAMVVTKSIIAAIKYKQAFDTYLKEINSPYKAIVAFSGIKEYKGVDYSETEMNNFASYRNDIPKNFKKSEYRFLIVANKYQTGFDQPLLHTMYVDKKLFGVTAVQTLSRLNRSYKPFKKDTFILDFFNKSEEIKEAFAPYYTSTILSEETDPNKLNELVDKLEKYEVFYEDQVKEFFKKYSSGAERTQLDPMLDGAAAIFNNELNINKKIDFKSRAKSFLRVYSYLTKIISFKNLYYEQLWWFLKMLVPKLIVGDDEDNTQEIIAAVNMDSYRPSKQGTEKIKLDSEPGVIAPIPVDVGGGKVDPDLDTLENIIKVFNNRFGDIEWTDKDKVNKILIEQIPADMKADVKVMDAIVTSPDRQNAKISSDKKLEELMQQYLFTQTEIFKKFSTDKDFQRRYKEFIFDTLWRQGGSAVK